MVIGDEDPYGDPRIFRQITKYLSVSSGRPGPINEGHHVAASVLLVSEWPTTIALSPAAFRVPQES
jgi:hypothetical protein